MPLQIAPGKSKKSIPTLDLEYVRALEHKVKTLEKINDLNEKIMETKESMNSNIVQIHEKFTDNVTKIIASPSNIEPPKLIRQNATSTILPTKPTPTKPTDNSKPQPQPQKKEWR